MELIVAFKGYTIPLDFKEADTEDFWSIREKGVYMINNEYGEVLYIGTTNNIGKRLFDHFKGHTNTSYFTEEMFVAMYYPENDEYEREALEKILINQFRPVYNATYDSHGKGRLSTSEIMDIRWYARSGKHTYQQIAKAYDISVNSVQKISDGKLHPTVKVQDDYVPSKKLKETKKPVSKEALEKAYLMVLGGKSQIKTSEETGIALGTLKQFLGGNQTGYVKIRKELEEKHGEIRKGHKRTSDEEVTQVLTLRYVENLQLKDIYIKTGLAESTVKYICYGVGRFKEVKETFIENLVPIN